MSLINRVISIAFAVVLMNLSISGNAHALTLSAKCEASSSRSRITVIASGVRGTFWSIVLSGGISKGAKPKTTNPSGVVVFKFDSNPAAISAGATPIPVSYIKNNYIIARLRDAFTNRLLGAVGPTCTVIK